MAPPPPPPPSLSPPARILSISSSGSKKEKKERIKNLPISPYSVSLHLRTKDAFADIHNEDLDPSQLPAHHSPTLATNMKKAALGSAPKGPKKKLKEKRDKLIEKLTLAFGSSSRKQALKEGNTSASQMLTNTANSFLPLLSFKNPWKSYRAPGLWDMLHGGLQWGLPDDYFEGGGKGRYKGGGKHLDKIEKEMQEAEKDGLRKGWETIEIRKPDWGMGEEPQQKGSENENENQEGFAKATWLGHATTLLQLPSIAPDDQPLKDQVEKEQEIEEHQDLPTGGKGKKEVVKHEKKVEDVRKRTVNILFDPIFSERCSPSQVAGPIRFTPAPCQVEDLPPIDIVCISHNHYDHLDYDTMTKLLERRGSALKVFVPLGNKSWFVDSGFSKDQVIEMDWYDEAVLSVPSSTANSNSNSSSSSSQTQNQENQTEETGKQVEGKRIRVICTPAQHGSGRGGGDKMSALWSSWMIEHITPTSESASEVKDKGDRDLTSAESKSPEDGTEVAESSEAPNQETIKSSKEKRFRAFFAGDTGLRYHNTNIKKKEQYPVCPAFEEITSKYGPPSLLFLPISVGSSLSYFRSWDPFPRRFSPFPRVAATLTSSIHMDPDDSVEVAGIMRGKGLDRNETEREGQTCLAVHYGTFIRNEAQTAEDLRYLRRACLRAGMHFVRSDAGKIESSCSSSGDASQLKSKSRDENDRPGTAGSWGADSAFGVGTGSKNLERETSPTTRWNKTKHENKALVKAMENERGRKGRFVVSDQGETVWIRM